MEDYDDFDCDFLSTAISETNRVYTDISFYFFFDKILPLISIIVFRGDRQDRKTSRSRFQKTLFKSGFS